LETANAHLQRTSAELARSNQELEQFAYVASHDLQEPLRAVTGYLGLIEKQLGDQLEDKVRHHVDGAVQGASRMHTLITDLLALSRVGTRGHALQPAGLDAVLDQALEGLGASVRETGATIARDPLPILRVDASQMAQLFQNLIGNALKFRGERPPEIHVSAERKPDQWVLGVRDNGIGIESQYFERIFLIFQRLHTRKHYSGTGIGLAICKKIVERHGGAIWVESQPGQGSTFYFSIPNGENHGDLNSEPRSGPAD
jgi:light-regulated signal transduction histidine kinase (bacteriophytochrome)